MLVCRHREGGFLRRTGELECSGSGELDKGEAVEGVAEVPRVRLGTGTAMGSQSLCPAEDFFAGSSSSSCHRCIVCSMCCSWAESWLAMLVFREAQGVESLDSSLAPNILISGRVTGATRLTWRVLPVSKPNRNQSQLDQVKVAIWIFR